MRRLFALTVLVACFVAFAGNAWGAGGTCTQDQTQLQTQTPLQTRDLLQTHDQLQLQDQSCTDPSGTSCKDNDYSWFFHWLFGI